MDIRIGYSRSLPVRHQVDLCVCGGGPAGITAALAAARRGLNVFLIEQSGAPGGMGTSGLVPGFCQFSDGENLLVAGLGKEIALKVNELGGAGPESDFSEFRVWDGFAYNPEILKRAYDLLLIEAGVTIRYGTTLVDVVREGSRVTHVVLHGKGGVYAVEANMFVDGTGDAQLCWQADSPTEMGGENGETQGMTLPIILAGIDYLRRADLGGKNIPELLEKAFADGHFRNPDLHHPGVWQTGERIGGGNVGHIYGGNAVDDEDLSNAYIEGRALAQEFASFYKKYVSGFEGSELAATASLMGVRETRRVVGEYELTVDDFVAQASFDDEIGRYCYPIDIHPSSNNTEDYKKFEKEFRSTYRLKKGESYGIPYRSLIPKDLENVLVAGRCISMDRYVQGSLRVMPGCYLTGQAAGTAVAMAHKQDAMPRDVNASELRDELRADDAWLP
jgi:hypothetical protein